MPFADSAGARLYYETHGEGEPLLLVPGFTATVEVYFANTPALAEHFRVIVFDPRGSGRSESPTDGYTMEAFAGDCASVLDAASADAAHVLGTSFGGMVAQHLALLHPQRVRRLVLGCTTPGGAHHVLPPVENITMFMQAAEMDDPAAAARTRAPVQYTPAYFAEHEAEIVERAITHDKLGLRSPAHGRNGQSAAVQTHDTWERLTQIAAPVLVAHGEDDGIVPAANGRALASRISGAELRVYDARHMFFVERASEFNRDVLAFLSYTDSPRRHGDTEGTLS